MAKRTAKAPAAKVEVSTVKSGKAPVKKKPAALSKKAQHAAHWSEGNMGRATGMFLEQTMAAMRAEYNDPNIAVVGEAGRIVIGIPLPSIAIEYLLQNTVFPLSRIIQLVGTEGTFKSALTFEVARWFRQRAHGVSVLWENESKFSPDFASSIIGWDDPQALGHVECNSLENWQSKMQFWLQQARTMMDGTKENPGSGRTWPALGILDSLMGKLSEDTIKEIEKTGHAERRYALEAMKITDFLKKIPSDIVSYPISLITVNHLKKSKDERGLPIRNKSGGKQISFQETYELEMSKAFNSKFKIAANEKRGTPTITGRRLNIACYKNSLGETDRDIDVDIMWWSEPDPETGRMRQISVWDWFGANVKLLLGMEGGEKKRIDDIVDLHRVAPPGQQVKVWSDALGIKQKEPVEFHVAGEKIQKNKEIRNALRREFGIKPRKRFQTGVDYRVQLDQVRAVAEIEAEEAENAAFSTGRPE